MKKVIVKSRKVTFSEYQNCIQHVFGLYTSCIQAEYSLYTAGIQFVYSPNTICIRPEYKSMESEAIFLPLNKLVTPPLPLPYMGGECHAACSLR